MIPPQPAAAPAVAAVLADRYGMAVRDLVQLPIGQGTVNYRATCEDRATCEERQVFVKCYPPGTDLAAEHQAVGLSELARRHGVPAAAVVANRDGQLIDFHTEQPLSVWEWMPGRVVTDLTPTRTAQAGHALGRIHALFAALPASTGPAPHADDWLRADPARLQASIDQLLEVITDRTRAGIADDFDARAQQTLPERRAMLDRFPELLADLRGRGLTTQVLHSDFSPVNLLFAGDHLTAVLDFRPPEPFLLAYDLGRMAFYPNTVTGDPDWMQFARTFIRAYRQANPAVAAGDVLACGRVALVQLLGSLYGVKQHYLRPGLFQDDLDAFWMLRHRTVAILLDHLADVDALLTDLAAEPAHAPAADPEGEHR